MKAGRIQIFATGVLSFILVALLAGYFVPTQVLAARMAICGYGSCFVVCEGEDCHCGDVGPTQVSCWCENPGGVTEIIVKAC